MARVHVITFALIVQMLQSSAQAQKQHCKAAVDEDTVSLLQVSHADVHVQKESSDKKIQAGSSTVERSNVVGTSLKEEDKSDAVKRDVGTPAVKASQRYREKTQELAAKEEPEQEKGDDERELDEPSEADERQESAKPEDESSSSDKGSDTKKEEQSSSSESKPVQSSESKPVQSGGYDATFWFWSFIVALVLFAIACVGWVVYACKKDSDQTIECKVEKQEDLDKLMGKKNLVQFKGEVKVKKIRTQDGISHDPDEYQDRCKRLTPDGKPPGTDFPIVFVLLPTTFDQSAVPQETTPAAGSETKENGKVAGG